MEWTRLLSELRAAGLSQTDIATALGISQPSVSDLASGRTKNPSFQVGSKLVELHRNKVQSAPDSTPPAMRLEAPAV